MITAEVHMLPGSVLTGIIDAAGNEPTVSIVTSRIQRDTEMKHR